MVQLGVSDYEAVMAVFTPEYLQMPPCARVPAWMLEDGELIEAWSWDIRTHMPPFPEYEPESARRDLSRIMTTGDSHDRKAFLVALRDTQPTERVHDWWDQHDARVWQLVEKAAHDGQAPREV